MIMPTRITILGKSELPEAPHAVMARFLNGADDLRRVTVNGVVQNISAETADWWALRVETGVGHFLTRLPKEDQLRRIVYWTPRSRSQESRQSRGTGDPNSCARV